MAKQSENLNVIRSVTVGTLGDIFQGQLYRTDRGDFKINIVKFQSKTIQDETTEQIMSVRKILKVGADPIGFDGTELSNRAYELASKKIADYMDKNSADSALELVPNKVAKGAKGQDGQILSYLTRIEEETGLKVRKLFVDEQYMEVIPYIKESKEIITKIVATLDIYSDLPNKILRETVVNYLNQKQ